MPRRGANRVHWYEASGELGARAAPQRVLAGCMRGRWYWVPAVLSRSGEGVPLATRRTTFDKRERERSKQAKAAAKRARRQDKSEDDPEITTTESNEGGFTTESLLKRIETLHEDYDAGRISFEDFDEQKSELVDRLAICLAE